MIKHKDITGIDVHVPFRQVFVNEAERLACTDVKMNDVNKIAIQEDDTSIWILTNHDPMTQQRS